MIFNRPEFKNLKRMKEKRATNRVICSLLFLAMLSFLSCEKQDCKICENSQGETVESAQTEGRRWLTSWVIIIAIRAHSSQQITLPVEKAKLFALTEVTICPDIRFKR
ncbi:MAG: hypothetical protein MZV63_44045 [Marinilabiliales bacterium]|nr:hypothetical protein [Marinilabiliales bacterium]